MKKIIFFATFLFGVFNGNSKLEIPAYTSSEQTIVHTGDTVSYNQKALTPNWVAYELTRDEVAGTVKRSNEYQEDPAVRGRQATLEDYRGSGWDRGHMAPAADMKWSSKAMTESFFLTNMCPQNNEFNAGAWETTEKMGRRLANTYGKVYIVCGPIYTKNHFGTIGRNKVKVPDAFFKAFLIESNGTYAAIAFVMQNIPGHQDLKASSMTVNDLEKKIGRNLFPNLPDSVEEDVESKIVKKYWGI
ncbi:MAG: DNA/RNA non-specific endonuclease [Bacteroidales bacterium]|nr:DNA/RNA non-specific endonuclease [Bacteroidales bacterium]